MTEGLQMKGINEADIDDNDILLGRGGKTNHHPGNASYLKLIEARQVEYMFLESRTEKTEYAMNFVQKLRKEGIRFLKKDDKDGKKWSDVGDVKMREKVSQNLREHQPKLKKQLAEKQRLEAQQQQQMSKQQQQNPGGMMGMVGMPNLTQQTSGGSSGMGGGGMGGGMPQLMQQTSGGSCMPNNMNNNMNFNNNNNPNCSPINPRQFVDHQQMMQQQQFLQMQAMAQQNQMQQQQQFQMLQQQMNRRGSNESGGGGSVSSGGQFQNYPGGMMNAANGMNMNGMNNGMMMMGNNMNNMNMNGMMMMGNNMNMTMNNMTMQQQQILSMGNMGGMGGGNNNMGGGGVGVDPLPFDTINATGGNQWGGNNANEGGGNSNHRMSSLTALPETIESSLVQQQEQFAQNDRAFSKQQMFADRNQANFQSSESLPEPDEPDEMPLNNIAKPSLGSRVATLTDVDVAVAMGESTHSLLDSLHIEKVPEEQEGETELSPIPNVATIGTLEQVTPVLANKNKFVPPFVGFGGGKDNVDPARVTPGAGSPKQKSSGNVCVLDSDMLQAWANTADSDDDSFANAIGGEDEKFSSQQQQGGGSRNSNSNNNPSRPDPFRTASPTPPSMRGKLVVDGLSPRPAAMTKEKRATSNVNETPETRGHLKYQEGPLSDELTSSFSSTTTGGGGSIYSSTSSVKKASLGRDKSEQSRLLKQQYMPQANFSTGGGTSSSAPAFNGWPASLPLDNTISTLSPIPDQGGKAVVGTLQREVTPKTARVMQDFGKMTLSMAKQNGLTPSIDGANSGNTKFDNIGRQDPSAAHQMPMDLMVKKPAPLLSRNRTSTIEALDLDSLEDDTVLKEEREEKNSGDDGDKKDRTSINSINSIAGMWANMPTSEDFEALVSDIAGQEVSEGRQSKTPASLALPNLKA